MAYTIKTLDDQVVDFSVTQRENVESIDLVLAIEGGQYAFSTIQASLLAIEILRSLGYEGTNGYRSINYDVTKRNRRIADKQAETNAKLEREERLQKRLEETAMERFDQPYSTLNTTLRCLIMDLTLAQRELEESADKK